MSTAISFQDYEDENIDQDEYNKVLDSMLGVLPDTEKPLKDYRRERMGERYGFVS